ncbi:hypothetical protein U1Q18_041213 [Sarracenia purpurea var. burkii]
MVFDVIVFDPSACERESYPRFYVSEMDSSEEQEQSSESVLPSTDFSVIRCCWSSVEYHVSILAKLEVSVGIIDQWVAATDLRKRPARSCWSTGVGNDPRLDDSIGVLLLADLGLVLSNPVISMDCTSSAPCLRSVDRGLGFPTNRLGLKATSRSGRVGGVPE